MAGSPWWSDAAQVTSAVFTASAAGAAWASVLHGQRLWRRSLEPDLHPQVLKNAESGSTDLTVMNVGAGIAKGAAFVLVAGGQKAGSYIGDGFMPSGSKVHVSTRLPMDDDA